MKRNRRISGFAIAATVLLLAYCLVMLVCLVINLVDSIEYIQDKLSDRYYYFYHDAKYDAKEDILALIRNILNPSICAVLLIVSDLLKKRSLGVRLGIGIPLLLSGGYRLFLFAHYIGSVITAEDVQFSIVLVYDFIFLALFLALTVLLIAAGFRLLTYCGSRIVVPGICILKINPSRLSFAGIGFAILFGFQIIGIWNYLYSSVSIYIDYLHNYPEYFSLNTIWSILRQLIPSFLFVGALGFAAVLCFWSRSGKQHDMIRRILFFRSVIAIDLFLIVLAIQRIISMIDYMKELGLSGYFKFDYSVNALLYYLWQYLLCFGIVLALTTILLRKKKKTAKPQPDPSLLTAQ